MPIITALGITNSAVDSRESVAAAISVRGSVLRLYLSELDTTDFTGIRTVEVSYEIAGDAGSRTLTQVGSRTVSANLAIVGAVETATKLLLVEQANTYLYAVGSGLVISDLDDVEDPTADNDGQLLEYDTGAGDWVYVDRLHTDMQNLDTDLTAGEKRHVRARLDVAGAPTTGVYREEFTLGPRPPRRYAHQT